MDMPDDELTGWLEARCERWLLNRTCTTLCAISPTRVREQSTLGKSNTAIGRCPGLCERFSQQEPMDGWMDGQRMVVNSTDGFEDLGSTDLGNGRVRDWYRSNRIIR